MPTYIRGEAGPAGADGAPGAGGRYTDAGSGAFHTTDATADQEALSVADPGVDGSYMFEAHVSRHNEVTNIYASFIIQRPVSRIAGVLSVVSMTYVEYSNTAPTPKIALNGANVIVQVTGVAATNHEWFCRLYYKRLDA